MHDQDIQGQIEDYGKWTEASGPHSKLGKFYRRQIQQLEQVIAYYNQFRSYGEFEPKTVTEPEWSQELETLPAVHDELKKGAEIHAFKSGGGLRVVSVSKGKKEIGYGESPFIEDALVLANRDIQAGGKPYGEVYGKEYPHFLTGSGEPSSNLDEWILCGNTFDISQAGNNVTIQLHGSQQTEFPQELVDQVIATGTPATWSSNRGFTYSIRRYTFANNEHGLSGSVLAEPEGTKLNPWLYKITKTGLGLTIDAAVKAAFCASPVEVIESSEQS